MNLYIIYHHISPSGKVYVGQTKSSIEHRAGHNGIHYKDAPYFWKAIQKYGWDKIEHKTIAWNLSKKEADAIEIAYIKHFKALGLSYNIASGGEGGCGPCSEETKRKISLANMGNKSCVGRKVSEETRERMRAAQLGKKLSEDTKLAMSKARKGRKLSDEAKEKLRLVNLGRKLPESAKKAIGEKNSLPVIQLTLLGEFVKEWPSISAAATYYGIAGVNIGMCCSGKRKTSAGFMWKFKEK